jgi:exonuclease III
LFYVLFMDHLMQNYKIMSWNVRGLNNPALQEDVKQVISTFNPDLIYLQETKLSCLNNFTIRSILAPQFENSFVFLPATGPRGGGILLVAKDSIFQLQNPVLTENTISATIMY